MNIKKKYYLKESDIFLIIIVLILIVSFIFIKIFTYKSEPILMDYAKRKSNNIISLIINKSINDVIYKKNYDDIIIINKDNNLNIVSLDFNNKEINEILYLITEDILESVYNLENGNYDELNASYISNKDKVYYVPMGIIHDIPILTNLGPKIPFKIEILGSVNNSSKNNIKEYGINSFIIEVFITISLQIQVILPFKSEIFDVKKDILLDSKIVQGKIPEYYGGMVSTSLK